MSSSSDAGTSRRVQAGEDDAVAAVLLFDPHGGVGGQAVGEFAVGAVEPRDPAGERGVGIGGQVEFLADPGPGGRPGVVGQQPGVGVAPSAQAWDVDLVAVQAGTQGLGGGDDVGALVRDALRGRREWEDPAQPGGGQERRRGLPVLDGPAPALEGRDEGDGLQDGLAVGPGVEVQMPQQVGQELGDGVVAGFEHLLVAVVGLLGEFLDGVGGRVDRRDVHGVEHRPDVALGVGRRGDHREPGLPQQEGGGVEVLEGTQPFLGHLRGRVADHVTHHQVEDLDRLVGGDLRHHCGERH